MSLPNGQQFLSHTHRGYQVAGYYTEDPGRGRIALMKNGQVARQVDVLAYKLWNYYAHATDVIDAYITEIEEDCHNDYNPDSLSTQVGNLQQSKPLCDTTMTPRNPSDTCICFRRTDQMGPCDGFLAGFTPMGSIPRCVYCDHESACHPEFKDYEQCDRCLADVRDCVCKL